MAFLVKLLVGEPGIGGRLLGGTGFTYARLPYQHYQLALFGEGAIQSQPQLGHLQLTADEPASRNRLTLLWGQCYEGEGAPPYWPWLQPIRSYVQSTDPDQLASIMGAGMADLAEIVSELRDALPYLKPPLELEPEQARFRLLGKVLGQFDLWTGRKTRR